MNKFTAMLFFGMTLLVVWLILCFTNPWAGYIMSLACFIALAGFIIFIFACYAIGRHRANRKTRNVMRTCFRKI